MVKPIFRSNGATGLLRYAEGILLKMTENADLFVEPNPSLETLKEKLNAYREAYAEASFRDMRAVIVKSKTGKRLQEVIYRLSHYVDALAEGDAEIIVAAGYRPSRPATKRLGRVPQVRNMRIEHVKVGTGVLRVRVKAWRPARLYRYEYRMLGTSEWVSVLHSKSVLVLENLRFMEQYEIRATYLGTEPTPNYSDIIVFLVV